MKHSSGTGPARSFLRTIRLAGSFGIAVVAALAACPANAQDAGYPSKSIELVVPAAPGGGLDLHARILAEALTAKLGKSIVVMNKPGAGGVVGMGYVARAQPDGYTLLLQGVSNAIVTGLTMEGLTYDPYKDLVPVSLMVRYPLALTINKDLPVNTVAEFIELAKKNPGKYSYGHSGIGTQLELVGEFFKMKSATDLTAVPYQGAGPILPDLLAGRVSMMLNGLPAESERIKNRKVKALAVTSAERSPVAPEIPTLKETYPDFDMPFWIGIYAPAKTPKPIIDTISREIAAVMKSDTMKKKLAEIGSDPVGSTPEELAAYGAEQYKLYGAVVDTLRRAKVKLGD